MGRMKFPNGYGSITKLSGKRRKPFRVRKSIGYDSFGVQQRITLGYAETFEIAFKMLSEYNNDPFDIDFKKITFENLYSKWIENKKQEYNDGKLSKKSIIRYENAYKYYSSIYNKPFIDLKIFDLQTIIYNCKYGYHTKSDIKLLYLFIYKFATAIEIPVKKNIADYVDIGKPIKSTSHKIFTDQEIKFLWENLNIDYVGAILIQIYCGLRPSELLSIKDIHLNERYMIGGIKTTAGIDRIIPINEKIVKLVEEYLLTDKLKITYKQYYTKFQNVMKKLHLEHNPHDCRHTLATMLDNSNANKICIKLILGHEIKDITDGTYTHKNINQLIETINLI